MFVELLLFKLQDGVDGSSVAFRHSLQTPVFYRRTGCDDVDCGALRGGLSCCEHGTGIENRAVVQMIRSRALVGCDRSLQVGGLIKLLTKNPSFSKYSASPFEFTPFKMSKSVVIIVYSNKLSQSPEFTCSRSNHRLTLSVSPIYPKDRQRLRQSCGTNTVSAAYEINPRRSRTRYTIQEL